MTRRALLRASDADREQIAERVRQAAAEGRLSADELEDRLGAALSARTYGELDVIVSDLPAPPVAHRRRAGRSVGLARPVAVALAVVLVLILVSAVNFVLAGHPHQGRHWMYGARAGTLIWLIWLVIVVRYLVARRGRVR